MRKGWEEKRFDEVCVLQRGFDLPTDSRKVGSHPLVSSNGITDWIDQYKVKGPGVITGRSGTIGNIHFIEQDYWPLNTALYIKDFHGNDEKFIYYFLEHFNLARFSSGTGVPTLNRNHVHGVKVLAPTFRSEQQQIVSILDEAFAAIDQAKQNLQRNLQNAKDLFQSELNQMFTADMGRWPQKKLGELCRLTRGHNPPKSQFISNPKDGYVRFYQIRDGWSDEYKVYVPDSPKLHRVKPSDILMVAYRHIGKVFRGVEGAFNVALCKIQNVRRDILDDDYLFYLIPTDIIRGELMKRSERSLIPSMSVEHLKEITIPLPAIHEQQEILARLNSLSVETKKIEDLYRQKLNNLEELKKSILERAFRGELTHHSSLREA